MTTRCTDWTVPAACGNTSRRMTAGSHSGHGSQTIEQRGKQRVSKGEEAMRAVGELVQETLAEGGPGWSFVLICRLDDAPAYESVIYDGTHEEATTMMERAAKRTREKHGA